MTNQEFYGEKLSELLWAEKCLLEIAQELQDKTKQDGDLQKIVYFCSRIKSPESAIKKLASRGFSPTPEEALKKLFDVVGVRIVCAFESDVFSVMEMLENRKEYTILEKKDYLSFPKQNGYRSIHLRVAFPSKRVLAEIQVRTIAMDCWATLEHQLKYKKNIQNEALMAAELKRCADEIASVDLSMQTIRDLLKEQNF